MMVSSVSPRTSAPRANNTTTFAYDPLNRLTQLTEPQGSARTGYAYDALGRLASVTDPRNRVTSYANNWLDEPTTISSPDTRITTKTYDAAGNVLTSRDARGQTTTYLYDKLNRRVRATHADGSVFTFVYDQGTNAKGRLTSLTDTTGTTSWTYDGHGHVLRKTQVTGAVTLTTSWAYDAATGRLTSMTYPSGYKINYAYDAGARVSAIGRQPPGQASTTFIDQIAYSPFGPVASWRQAAGGSYVRRFDRDGRITGITSSTGLALTYAYDAGGRVASIAESGRPTKTFFYDRNDRLTAYYFGESSIGYAYDASGNRTENNGQFNTIEASSNRLMAMTAVVDRPARQLAYDAVGDMTNGGGGFTFAFDVRNRLMRSTVGALVTNYSVNGLGQRVAKSGPAGQVEYYYDLAGRLLGSYGAAAVVREEIVWLGDLPVGTIQGGAAYHIAPDRLGTPHQIVNSANAQVWYWDHHPFGETRSITAAAGFRHELRFPGHIYDSETGLHNNGFRDYWPFLGRYIESDPIGIAGGIGTYSYAGNNPVNAIDPFGLDPKRAPEPEPGLTSPCIECYLIPSLRLPDVARFAYGLYQSYRALSGIETNVKFDVESEVPLVVRNKIAGDAFRDELARALRAEGRDVTTEVYKSTPFGKRFIDIEVSKDGQVLGGIETKVGSSRYTWQQQLKDWWLKDAQGYIVNVARDK